RIDGAVAAEAGRRHAIEGVHALLYAEQQVARLPYPEKMARLTFRQVLHRRLERAHHVLLAERAADAEPIEVHARDLFRALLAQVLIPAALHDAEDALLAVRFDVLAV